MAGHTTLHICRGYTVHTVALSGESHAETPWTDLWHTHICASSRNGFAIYPAAQARNQGESFKPSSSSMLNLTQILLPRYVMKEFLPNSPDRTLFQTIIRFLPGLLQPLIVYFLSDFTLVCSRHCHKDYLSKL